MCHSTIHQYLCKVNRDDATLDALHFNFEYVERQEYDFSNSSESDVVQESCQYY